MTLTNSEETRLRNAERTVQSLKTLIENAGSKNQLNRLLVLAQEEIKRLTTKVDSLEAEQTVLLGLLRKLQ